MFNRLNHNLIAKNILDGASGGYRSRLDLPLQPVCCVVASTISPRSLGQNRLK